MEAPPLAPSSRRLVPELKRFLTRMPPSISADSHPKCNIAAMDHTPPKILLGLRRQLSCIGFRPHSRSNEYTRPKLHSIVLQVVTVMSPCLLHVTPTSTPPAGAGAIGPNPRCRCNSYSEERLAHVRPRPSMAVADGPGDGKQQMRAHAQGTFEQIHASPDRNSCRNSLRHNPIPKYILSDTALYGGLSRGKNFDSSARAGRKRRDPSGRGLNVLGGIYMGKQTAVMFRESCFSEQVRRFSEGRFLLDSHTLDPYGRWRYRSRAVA